MVTERRLVRLVGRVPLCLLVVSTVAGCNSGRGVGIKIHWGPMVKYSDFGPTFDWVRGVDDTPAAEQALHELICNTVEQELIGKGYVKNTAGNPELWIEYRVVRKSRPDRTGHGWHEEGALILDIIDPDSKQRYWRGIAEAMLHHDDAPDARRKRVSQAIRGMLAQFPAADVEIDNP